MPLSEIVTVELPVIVKERRDANLRGLPVSINTLIPGIHIYLASSSLKLIKWDVGFALYLFEGDLHAE